MVVRLPRALARGLVRASLRQVLAPGVPFAVQRRAVDAMTAITPMPAGMRAHTGTLADVPARTIRPRTGGTDRALLYLHGGGFVSGSSFSHRGLAARIATGIGATAFVPDYRLAPEHPHPAALHDALACYRELLRAGHAPDAIAVAGDSAGAGLALALAIALREAGEPLPAVLGLVSPWVDLELTAASVTERAAVDPLLRADWLTACAKAYRNWKPAKHPAVSPLHAELAGLPPLVVHSGADEILADDAARLIARATASGVPVSHREFSGLWHDFQLFGGLLADADAAVADLSAALLVRLGGVLDR